MKKTNAKKWLMAAWSLLSLANPASAAQTGASFLSIPQGARAMGLSNAFTVVEDPTALFHNIAGIANVGRTASFSHQTLSAERQTNTINLTQPSSLGTMGVGFVRLSNGTIEGRDAQGNAAGGFEAYDQSINIGLARKTEFGRVGFGVKFISQRIASDSASGVAIDMGVQKRMSHAFSAGLAVQNLGNKIKFGSEAYDLPLTVSAGASLRATSNIGLFMDVKHMPHEKQSSMSIGTEYDVIASVQIRAGYLALVRSNASTGGGAKQPALDLSGLGAGIGFKLKSASFDYAFTPSTELGASQRLTLGYKF